MRCALRGTTVAAAVALASATAAAFSCDFAVLLGAELPMPKSGEGAPHPAIAAILNVAVRRIRNAFKRYSEAWRYRKRFIASPRRADVNQGKGPGRHLVSSHICHLAVLDVSIG